MGDRLFEGEEPILHLMGEQIAAEKRRNRTRALNNSLAQPSSNMRSQDLPGAVSATLAISICCNTKNRPRTGPWV